MSETPETSQSATGPYVAMAASAFSVKARTAAFRASLLVKVPGGDGGDDGGDGGDGGGDGGDGGAGGNGGKPMTMSAVSVEPLMPALSRVAFVKSMVELASPAGGVAAVITELLRSALVRSAAMKSMVAAP